MRHVQALAVCCLAGSASRAVSACLSACEAYALKEAVAVAEASLSSSQERRSDVLGVLAEP